jgi:transcription termination/antitermination protein NusA
MNSIGLIDSFQEFKEFKNIDRATMMKVLEDVFLTLLKKKYGNTDNFDIIVNTDKGDLEIYHRREVVEDGAVENPVTQVSHTDAQTMGDGFDIGEETYEEVKLDFFGRRSVQAAKQTLQGRITELEKDEIFRKYKDREGELITGEVHQIWKRDVLILDEDGTEMTLPKNEQIRSDFYKKGDVVRGVISKVDYRNNNPKIIVSRTDPKFLERLLELEVPEIYDNIIGIVKIVREPGEKAKVAVQSFDERVDPIGACVGVKGSRIHGIVKELRNENIDVVNYTTNLPLFIQRALAPAVINSVEINDETKRVKVFLEPDQVSLAIGKGGQNIKLASKLIDMQIDVFRDIDDDVEDIDLDEFGDEIEQWIIDEFKKIGLDTARAVLNHNNEELARRTDLELETVEELVNVLKAEFEDAPVAVAEPEAEEEEEAEEA